MRTLPEGTVTFLMTDIEQSTMLLGRMGRPAYARASEDHFGILRQAVADHRGHWVKTEGDSLFAVFADAREAVAAAVDSQRALQAHPWEPGHELHVRMGLHTGNAQLGGDDYVGLDVNHAARVADAGHGGQIIVSQVTAGVVSGSLPEGASLQDLGSHRLKDFEAEHLFQLNIEGLRCEFPPLRTLAGPTDDRLPVQLTSFIGRATDVAAVAALLETHRIVTLVGPGGIGKTRLGIEVGRATGPSFRHGVQWVGLADVAEPGAIGLAISDALGLRTTIDRNPLDQVAAFLSSREMLLILDNYEHLAADVSPVSRVLETCPGVKILVTSRVSLHISAEQIYPVDPLETSTDDNSPAEGEALFIERALEVDPAFDHSAVTLREIGLLTRRLDGVPLAIELAASRVKVLSVDSILDRLNNRLLASPSPDRPTRQQTMAAAIGWSYDLLTRRQQVMLAKLSVLVGGAELAEIEELLHDDYEDSLDILDDLSGLVDHNLVRRTRSTPTRYRLLAVIREFADEKLEELAGRQEMRDRHATVFADLVSRSSPHLLTVDRADWLDKLARDHDNIRAALDHVIERSDTDTALAIVSAMWRFWQTRGPLHEAADKIARALSLPDGDPLLRARAVGAAGGIAYWSGDFEEMSARYDEAMASIEALGPSADLAEAQFNVSFSLSAAGRFDEAREMVEASTRTAEEIGDPAAAARGAWGRFNVAWYAGEVAGAEEHARESMALFEQSDRGFYYGWACFAVGDTLIRAGKADEAEDALRRTLRDFLRAGDLTALILFLRNFAAIAVLRGQTRRAARLVGASQSLMERTGSELSENEAWLEPTEETWGSLRELRDLAPDEIVEGREMSPEEAVDYAMEQGVTADST